MRAEEDTDPGAQRLARAQTRSVDSIGGGGGGVVPPRTGGGAGRRPPRARRRSSLRFGLSVRAMVFESCSFELDLLLGARVPRREDRDLVNACVERHGFAQERARHVLAVDLHLGVLHARRLHLDDESGDARLHLRELRLGLIDGRLERGRRARRQGRTQDLSVGLCGLDEPSERSVALGDAKEVRRRGKDLLRALELVERLGEVARALELVALLEELARPRALGVAHLSECPRGRPQEHGRHRGSGREGKKSKVSHARWVRRDQYPGSAGFGEGLPGAGLRRGAWWAPGLQVGAGAMRPTRLRQRFSGPREGRQRAPLRRERRRGCRGPRRRWCRGRGPGLRERRGAGRRGPEAAARRGRRGRGSRRRRPPRARPSRPSRSSRRTLRQGHPPGARTSA